jgi:hypothetical protein
MTPKREYAKPSIESITVPELLSEAERLMRRSRLELEDLEIVKESVETRIGAMQTAVQNLSILLLATRNAIEKVNAIYDLQRKASPWHPDITQPFKPIKMPGTALYGHDDVPKRRI